MNAFSEEGHSMPLMDGFMSRYAPHFFGADDTFASWAVVALIALVATVVWTVREPKRVDYPALQ